MKKRVYIETSIVSYLTARPTRDLIRMAHQQITLEWWEQYRHEFSLHVSQLVLDEAARGDPDAARRRSTVIRALPLLPLTDEAIALAERLVGSGLIDEKAAMDALHLGVATTHGMDFLLTWNCRHLANARMLTEIGRFVRTMEYELPFVCTPEELMGGEP